MIATKALGEIREKLETAQNPLFLFDNDTDGLCSFLILRRALGRGRGIPIKSFPELKEQYLRRVDELNPDLLIVLDKAEIEEAFIKGANQRNIEVLWIDHHQTQTPKEAIHSTHYYNSLPTAEPTTFIAHKVFERKEDEWLAMIGCIGDVFTPDFAKDFEKAYPELYNHQLEAFDALHSTEIGRMVRMLNFGLMDTTTNVVRLIKYLFNAKGPYDLLEENYHTRNFHASYSELNSFYQKKIDKALEGIDETSPLIYFSYSGNTSMSSLIANKLYFMYPEKLIFVAYIRPEKVNVSIRGKKALTFTKELVKTIPGSTGGGHEEATGAMIPALEKDTLQENILTIMNAMNEEH